MNVRTARLVLLVVVVCAAMTFAGVSSAYAAGSTYTSDAYDPGDDSPGGAYDLNAHLSSAGVGYAPWAGYRTFDEADASSTNNDPDWFYFDVSAQQVIWDYAYLFEAIGFWDLRVDPVIEIYGPFASWSSVNYQYGHNFAPPAPIDPLAIAGNTYGEWYNWAPNGQATNLGASLEFHPSVAGRYWIRVRPYGDNTGSFYRDGAGVYIFRAKVGMATRVAGADRIDTAVAISQERFADDQLNAVNMQYNLSSAIVVNGYVFPDALSASSLAGVCQGPVLLTRQNSLPAATAAELQRLNPDIVYIVGGTSAVTDNVKTQIEALFPSGDPVSVQRIHGPDRIATSVAVADKALGLSSQTPASPPGFGFICNAYNFPDALSASSMAAGNFVPILLTGGSTLDPRIDAEITARGLSDVIIVGGTSVISPAIQAALEAKLGPTHVLRLAGADRYETSKEFASWAAGYPGGGNVGTPGNPNALRPTDKSRIGLCTGQNFPDALAAGPFCGDDWDGTPKAVLLTRGDYLSKWVVDAYGQLGPGETSYFDEVWSMGIPSRIDRVYLFGGSAALGDGVWWAIDTQS